MKQTTTLTVLQRYAADMQTKENEATARGDYEKAACYRFSKEKFQSAINDIEDGRKE